MRRYPVSNSILAHALLLAVVVVWGATFPLVKAALRDASPLLFNAIRMSIATVALVLINFRQLRSASRPAVLAGLAAGLLLGAGYQFQTAGLARTTATRSALITGLVVVFVPLLALLPFVSSPGTPGSVGMTVSGALLAFAGVALLTTAPGTRLTLLFNGMNGGDSLTLLCALAFAGHLLFLARVSTRVPPGLLATVQIGSATVLMLISLPFSGHLTLHLTSVLVFALIVTGLLATAAAFTIQSWAQRHLPATHIAALLSLEPVFALATARMLLGEHLSSRALLGAGLVLGGIVLIEVFALPSAIASGPTL